MIARSDYRVNEICREQISPAGNPLTCPGDSISGGECTGRATLEKPPWKSLYLETAFGEEGGPSSKVKPGRDPIPQVQFLNEVLLPAPVQLRGPVQLLGPVA